MFDADFRPIVLPDDFKPTPKPPPDLALEWIPISALVIDTGYQRPLARENWNKINAIAAAFDWRFFTPVLVSPLGDGRYALIDGQHRSHAALRAGYDAVPALVVPMSRAHQASSFMAVNGAVTKVSMFHLYRAGSGGLSGDVVEPFGSGEKAGRDLLDFDGARVLPGGQGLGGHAGACRLDGLGPWGGGGCVQRGVHVAADPRTGAVSDG